MPLQVARLLPHVLRPSKAKEKKMRDFGPIRWRHNARQTDLAEAVADVTLHIFASASDLTEHVALLARRCGTKCQGLDSHTLQVYDSVSNLCCRTQGRNQMVFSEGGKLIVTFRCTIFGGTKCCIEQLKIYLKICEGGKFARLRAWGNFFAFGVRMKCGLSLCCVWTLHVFRIRKRYKPGSIAK